MEKNRDTLNHSDRTVAAANHAEQIDHVSATEQLHPPSLQLKATEGEAESTESFEEVQLKASANDGNSNKSTGIDSEIQLKTNSPISFAPPPLQFEKSEKKEETKEPESNEIEREPVNEIPEVKTESNNPAIQLKVDLPATLPAPPLPFKAQAKQEEEKDEVPAQFKLDYSFAPPSDDENSNEGNDQNSNADALQLREDSNPNESNTSSERHGPLPTELQSNIEQNLGTDLSNINIHKNSNKASEVGALAYTQGNDVHFAPGQFNPNSSAGKELIGHELTHVKQQREGRVQPTKEVNGMPVNDNPGLEKEADDLGKMAVQRKADKSLDKALNDKVEAPNEQVSQGKFEVAQFDEFDDLDNIGQDQEGRNVGENEENEQQEQPIPPTSVIRSARTEIIHSEENYTVSGTYREVKNLLHQRSEAGSIETGITSDDFTGTEERARGILYVTIVKSMPVWTNFPEIQNRARDENQENRSYYQRIVQVWNWFYSSLDAHEEEHIRIDVQHFRNCHTRVIGKTIAEAREYYTVIEGEANALNHTFHDTPESAIYDLPYIPQPGEGTVNFNPDATAQQKANPNIVDSNQNETDQSNYVNESTTPFLSSAIQMTPEDPENLTEGLGYASNIERFADNSRAQVTTSSILRNMLALLNAKYVDDNAQSAVEHFRILNNEIYNQLMLSFEGLRDSAPDLFSFSQELAAAQIMMGRLRSRTRTAMAGAWRNSEVQESSWISALSGVERLIIMPLQGRQTTVSNNSRSGTISRKIYLGSLPAPGFTVNFYLNVTLNLAGQAAEGSSNTTTSTTGTLSNGSPGLQSQTTTTQGNNQVSGQVSASSSGPEGQVQVQNESNGRTNQASISTNGEIALSTEMRDWTDQVQISSDSINYTVRNPNYGGIGLQSSITGPQLAVYFPRIEMGRHHIDTKLEVNITPNITALGATVTQNARTLAVTSEMYGIYAGLMAGAMVTAVTGGLAVPVLADAGAAASAAAAGQTAESLIPAGISSLFGTMTGGEMVLQLKENNSNDNSQEFEDLSNLSEGTIVDPPEELVAQAENVIQAKFSTVQFYKDSETALSLNALAYTEGNNVHFAPGQFKPNTKSGKELIGHELKHVEQQAEGKVRPTIQKKGKQVNNDQSLEKEADEFGSKLANNQTTQLKIENPKNEDLSNDPYTTVQMQKVAQFEGPNNGKGEKSNLPANAPRAADLVKANFSGLKLSEGHLEQLQKCLDARLRIEKLEEKRKKYANSYYSSDVAKREAIDKKIFKEYSHSRLSSIAVPTEMVLSADFRGGKEDQLRDIKAFKEALYLKMIGEPTYFTLGKGYNPDPIFKEVLWSKNKWSMTHTNGRISFDDAMKAQKFRVAYQQVLLRGSITALEEMLRIRKEMGGIDPMAEGKKVGETYGHVWNSTINVRSKVGESKGYSSDSEDKLKLMGDYEAVPGAKAIIKSEDNWSFIYTLDSFTVKDMKAKGDDKYGYLLTTGAEVSLEKVRSKDGFTLSYGTSETGTGWRYPIILNELEQFAIGGIIGDFSEDPTATETLGQIVVGVIPFVGQVADARDTAAAIRKVWNSGAKDGKLQLTMAIIGWLPLVGDGIKAAWKGGGKKAATKFLVKTVVESKDALAKRFGKEIAENPSAWAKRFGVGESAAKKMDNAIEDAVKNGSKDVIDKIAKDLIETYTKHGKNPFAVINKAGGKWKSAIKILEKSPEGLKIAKEMEAYRIAQFDAMVNHVGKTSKQYGNDVSMLGKPKFERTGTPSYKSDFDGSFIGPNASFYKERADDYMSSQFGKNWRDTFDADIFTDPSRLHLFANATKDLTGGAAAAIEKRIVSDAELNVLAKMLNSGVDVSIIKKKAADLGVDLAAITSRQKELQDISASYLAGLLKKGNSVDSVKKQAADMGVDFNKVLEKQKIGDDAFRALELKMDSLHNKYLSTKDPIKRAAIAEEMAKLQGKLNASVPGPYMTPGGVMKHTTQRDKALRNLLQGAEFSPSMAYMQVLDDYYMLVTALPANNIFTEKSAKSFAKYADRLMITAGRFGAVDAGATAARQQFDEIWVLLSRARKEGAKSDISRVQSILQSNSTKLSSQINTIEKTLKDSSNNYLKELADKSRKSADKNMITKTINYLNDSKSKIALLASFSVLKANVQSHQEQKDIDEKASKVPVQKKEIGSSLAQTGIEEDYNHSNNKIPEHVDIHKDSSKASDLGALAFTQGTDIHFAPGQFKPDTRSGQELIGHELKHVEQQAEGRVSPTLQRKGEAINDNPALEKEADDFGKAYAEDLAKNPKVPAQRKVPEQAFQLKENKEIRFNIHSGTIQRAENEEEIEDIVDGDLSTVEPEVVDEVFGEGFYNQYENLLYSYAEAKLNIESLQLADADLDVVNYYYEDAVTTSSYLLFCIQNAGYLEENVDQNIEEAHYHFDRLEILNDILDNYYAYFNALQIQKFTPLVKLFIGLYQIGKWVEYQTKLQELEKLTKNLKKAVDDAYKELEMAGVNATVDIAAIGLETAILGALGVANPVLGVIILAGGSMVIKKGAEVIIAPSPGKDGNAVVDNLLAFGDPSLDGLAKHMETMDSVSKEFKGTYSKIGKVKNGVTVLLSLAQGTSAAAKVYQLEKIFAEFESTQKELIKVLETNFINDLKKAGNALQSINAMYQNAKATLTDSFTNLESLIPELNSIEPPETLSGGGTYGQESVVLQEKADPSSRTSQRKHKSELAPYSPLETSQYKQETTQSAPFQLKEVGIKRPIQKKEETADSEKTTQRQIPAAFSTSEDNTIQKKTAENPIPAYVNIHKYSTKATQFKARAYTQGKDIHFAPGQFKPETKSGQELIGHELKHVEQQAEGRVQPTIQKKGESINNDPGLEKEADDYGVKFANDQDSQLKIDNESNHNQAPYQLKEEGKLPVSLEQKSITPFSLTSEPENLKPENPLVQLKPAVQSADAPIMRKPKQKRPSLPTPKPAGPDTGDDPLANGTQAQKEQWDQLDFEIDSLRLKIYEAQQANWHPTRDGWYRRANSMNDQLSTTGTTEEMDSIRDDFDDLQADMWDAAGYPADEWSALKDEVALAGAQMLSLPDVSGIYAYGYLMKKFKRTSHRMHRIDEQMWLREDFVDLAEVIGTREYQSHGEMIAAFQRFRELMNMLDIIGDLRASGEDANKIIPGWEQLIDQEIDMLILLAGKASTITYTKKFSKLHGRLENAKQKTLKRKPKKMGFFDKANAVAKGAVGAVTDPLVEAAKQGVDLVKITAFTGYTALGGDEWEPELYSDMAKHVEQTGAGTWDILKQMPASIIETPERCFAAIKKGDWEAIGREGANLFMLAKAAKQAPGKVKQIPGKVKRIPANIKSAGVKALKVYRILKFRALSLQKGPGMSMAALKAVQKIAVEHGLEIAFRPVSRRVIKLRKLGHPGKPEFLKMKTISELDVHLGANKADIGKVGFFKPKKPGNLKGLSSSKKAEVIELYHKRRKEYSKLYDDVKNMVLDGKIEIRKGVVFKKGGKAYTGDHDPFSFTKDGVDIAFERKGKLPKLTEEIRKKLEADPVHVEHGGALSWDDIKAGQAEYYANNILKHRPGGERLVVFKPDGTIAREFFKD